MSVPSPSRVRTKTSELADFFRGHTRHTHHEPSESSQPPSPQTLLDIPSAHEPSTPRKITRIPFLGRTRKKSTHSVKSGAATSAGRGYDSEVVGEASDTKTDRRLSQPGSHPELVSRRPTLPTSASQPSVPPTSLGSKFVAHFNHVKSRKAPPSPRTSQAGPTEGSMSDTLSPPVSPRAASFDSGSTSTSAQHQSSDSRPGPTITVSLSPDNIDDYKDLFTLPRHKKPGIATPRRQSSTPASEYRDNYHKTESAVTLTPVSPRTEPPTSTTSSLRSDGKERDVRRLADNTRSSKISRRRTPSMIRSAESTPDDSTEESVRHLRTTDSSSVIDITPSPPPSKVVSPRLRMRSVSTKERASSPPTIPLPPPPRSTPPLPPGYTVISVPANASPKPVTSPPSTNVRTLTRPRANTIGSIPPSHMSPNSPTTPLARPASPKRFVVKLSSENLAAVTQCANKEKPDINAMTLDELKEALLTRNRQYDELAARFLQVAQVHEAEKRALQKKVAILEVESMRKDKEIQGYTWMLNNRGTSAPSAPPDYTKIPGPRTVQRSPSAASSRRFQYTDDSGAESHQSGAESVRGSESSHISARMKRGLRPLTLGLSESTYSIYRSSMSSKSGSGRGPAVDSGLSDQSQRASVYSVSSMTSATSSTSSLLPPSPGIPISSLSAIPESGAQIYVSPNRDSLSASEWETDDKRTPSKRISTSSSSSAAMSAYSANLKRGRPPSIAQVLQKSPPMDDVLDKLRPFAGSPACT
ncbi:hypothetical protein H0H81_005103 [Sphagnurus paluster]|uniref:Uncharacterized protein n=1 Tax=Sphagnurus paluster TaxID=117069 RepID=A0A9P7KJV2_9AGAR|nr:hypothetical protein H0H81_005103 [Sphagnurus paluster]